MIKKVTYKEPPSYFSPEMRKAAEDYDRNYRFLLARPSW